MAAQVPTLTIPDTYAHHVVGHESVPLAHGDLTLVLTAMSNPFSTGKTPVLMLTVGRAAFPLYSNTMFGTLASDERVYLFQPERGQGISGYVKIVLPDGVREPGSEFSALQERFEKILISRGLLKEGDGPNERSVTIPSVTAEHVLGKTTVELARGDLTLSTTTVETNHRVHDPKAILVLSVGESAFPLHLTTIFGTVADDEHVYVFKPEIHDANTPQGGYIKITLPEKLDKSVRTAQDKFEEMLVDYGLLKIGVEAASDEISRSIDEESSAAANSIRRTTANFLAENPPTESPATFPETAHNLAASSSSATSTLHNAAQSVSAAVSSAAASAGSFISSSVGASPPSKSTKDSVSPLIDVYDSVGRGTAKVKNAVSDAFGDVVQNEAGPEARDLGGKVAKSVGNVGAALGQVTEVGTGAVLVSGGVKGAVGFNEDSELVELGSDGPFVNAQVESGDQPAEEMATFSIGEKDEDGDLDFKEVSI